MQSMTGYGKGTIALSQNYVIELKSVNGRFLDINVKAGKQFLPYENEIKRYLQSRLSRGTVDVIISRAGSAEEASGLNVVINTDLAQKIAEQNKLLADALNIPENMTAKDLLRFEKVMSVETVEEDPDALKKALFEGLIAATDALLVERQKEGENLKADLKEHLDEMESLTNFAKQKAPQVVEEYAQKLEARLNEILSAKMVELDQTLLLNEVAIFADKADVNEEISRLFSHLKRFNELLVANRPIGKEIEFLSQEMTREINTLGSKANNIELTNCVLKLKCENEKIKEQLRNVE